MVNQRERGTISRGSGGIVSLRDIRSSISDTRTTFTRIRTRRFIDRDTGSAIQPDFITLVSLVCNIYREYEQDLVPIQQFHPNSERYEDGGHACVVTQRAISTITASNVKRGTTDALAEELAVKRTRESVLTQNSAGLRSFLNEVRIRTHPPIRNHPNIVKFKGVAWDFEDDEAKKPRPILLEELAPQKSLEYFWRQYDFVRMTFLSKVDLCIDIADGLAALHASHIVHGDVKPDNILVFPRIGHQNAFMAKLTDFGHSVSAHENLRALPAFTPPWAAPEVLDNSDLTFDGMKSADVYSYGLVALSIMIGRSYHRSLENVDKMKKDDTMFEEAMTLVEHEDREEYDSDFDLDIIRLLLRQSLIRKTKRRNLRRCTQILSRYKASQTGAFAPRQSNQAVEQPHILGPPNASQLVYIGYQSLVRCSHQLRSHIVQELSAIAMNNNDPRQPAAAWELSICYFSGFGAPRDFTLSSRWLNFASDHAIPAAQMFKNNLYEAMDIDLPIASDTKSCRPEPVSSTILTTHKIPEVSDHEYQVQSDVSTHDPSDGRLENSSDADLDHLSNIEVEEHLVDEESDSNLSAISEESSHLTLSEDVTRAIIESDLATLSALIAQNPTILNARDQGGNTPLLIAARCTLFSVVRLLLSFGSLDASIVNNAHESVLHFISGFKDNEVQVLVPQLLAKGADIFSESRLNRSEKSLMIFPAGIDACPVLRATLSGNLVLLKCLLDETHKTEGNLPCRVCEAGSRFRRIVAVALSTFRSEALTIMIDHIKKFKDTKIDLSKIKVWSARELVPLWKTPFQSLFVTTIDLPDSFFRAISFGRHHMTALESTMSFLLQEINHDPNKLLYEMLQEAVMTDNLDAVDFILREGQKRKLDPCWWLMTTSEAFLQSPFIVAIQRGHRDIFKRLHFAYPTVFKNLPIIDDGKLPWAAELFGETDKSYSQKEVVTTSSICLTLAVTAPHQDLYFIEYILREAKRKYITRTRNWIDDKVAHLSTAFLVQAILTSSFGAATMICEKYPETWRQSLPLPQSVRGDSISDIVLAIAFDNGNESLEPNAYSLSNPILHLVCEQYRMALGGNIVVPQYVFLLCSYDQCMFVLKHHRRSLSRTLDPFQSTASSSSRYTPIKCEDGHPQYFYNRLHSKEYHALVVGNIARDRKDRQQLWKLIGVQVSLGHPRSTFYLHLALRCGNDRAVTQLLDLGWSVNGHAWAPWTNHLWYTTHLCKESDAKWRKQEVYASGRWKKPLWSTLDTHKGLFQLYSEQELRVYDERKKTLKQICENIKDRGGSLPWLVILWRKSPAFWILIWLITYLIALPLIVAIVIGPHWKWQTSFQARLGWSWLWSVVAAVNPPIFSIRILPWYRSSQAFRRFFLGLGQGLLQHFVPIFIICFVDPDGWQWWLPFLIVLAEVGVLFVFTAIGLVLAFVYVILGIVLLFVDGSIIFGLHLCGMGWHNGLFEAIPYNPAFEVRRVLGSSV